MKSLLITMAVILFIFPHAYSQTSISKHHSAEALDCKECHTCETPTYEKPCLKIIPDFSRRKGITVHQSADEAAEIMKIDIISNLYEPTIFTHRLHAEMAGMAGGCVYCHHHNPPGRIATCRECHETTASGTDLNKPGLKGAYHRQCLNCHMEWSHSKNCAICHALKTDSTTSVSIIDKAKFKQVKHPSITEPTSRIYKTDEANEGRIVTFYHDDHVHRYGLKCINCHVDESCNRCHDLDVKVAKEDHDIHDNCINCHEHEIENNCKHCHDIKEKKRFTHKNTSFTLGQYHNNLKCSSCHGGTDQIRIVKPNKVCTHCHKNWRMGTFNHRVTGVVLDDNHIEHECENCHANRDFSVKPTCTECHDDISYPKSIPGNKVIE